MEILFKKYQVPIFHRLHISNSLVDCGLKLEDGLSEYEIKERLQSFRHVARGKKLFHIACSSHSLELVRFLVDIQECVNDLDDSGDNGLCYAAQKFPLEIHNPRGLIESAFNRPQSGGTDLDYEMEMNILYEKERAYLSRIKRGIALVKYLIDLGIDYSTKNSDGMTPIDLISNQGAKQEIINYISEI